MHKLSIPFANGISSPKTQRRLRILNTRSLIAYFLFNYSTTLFHFDDGDDGGENWTKNRIKVNRAENYYSILSINIPSIQMLLLKKCWYYHYCFPTIWYSFIFWIASTIFFCKKRILPNIYHAMKQLTNC